MIVDRSSFMTYLLSVFTMLTGFSVGEWVALGGFCLGVCTFLVNWHYKHQAYLINKQQLELNKDKDKATP